MATVILGEYTSLKEWFDSDIKQYMLIYALIVLLSPVIIIVRIKLLISNMRSLIGQSKRNREFAMNWFHSDVMEYKDMYPINERKMQNRK
jgi:hypothetical protein